GDLYAKVGRAREAGQQYALVQYIGRLNTLNRALYNRQLVYFYADHGIKPAEALELAQREIAVRKDIYGYDALAWALYKNDRAEEAVAPMKEALRLGTRDAMLFFHAGMISLGAGKVQDATHYLEQALATNQHFHVFQADVARGVLEQLRSNAARRDHDD